MCLQYVCEPKKTEGYAFKTVYPGKVPGEFRGQWAYFEKTGNGGVGNLFDSSGRKRNVVRNGIRWKVGRLYRVKHNRMAKAQSRMKSGGNYSPKTYRAGVHLYTSPFFDLRGAEVVMVCRYTSAVAQDRFKGVVVALRVTPVLILTQAEYRTFVVFVKKADGNIEQAVKDWQNI